MTELPRYTDLFQPATTATACPKCKQRPKAYWAPFEARTYRWLNCACSRDMPLAKDIASAKLDWEKAVKPCCDCDSRCPAGLVRHDPCCSVAPDEEGM